MLGRDNVTAALPVYLHFLDRELLRASQKTLSRDQLFSLIRVCALLANGPLVMSVAFAFESEIFKEPVPLWIEEGFQAGTLQMISAFDSVEEFLADARKLYAHDQSRYPMYFRDNPRIEFRPTFVKPSSTTEELAGSLADLLNHELGEVRGLPDKDVFAVIRSLQLIEESLLRRGRRALTMSLFASQAGHPSEAVNSIGKLLSRLHVKFYLEYCRGELLCGIPGCSWVDDLSPTLLELDLWWASRLLAGVGFNLSSHVHSGDEITTWRNTPVHLDMVVQLRTLIATILDIGMPSSLTPAARHQRLQHPAYSDYRRKYILPRLLQINHRGESSSRPMLETLEEVASRLSRTQAVLSVEHEFAASLERARSLVTPQPAKVLLLVSSDAEQTLLLNTWSGRFDSQAFPLFYAYHTVYHLGLLGGADVNVVRSSQSSIGPRGSELTVVDVIDQLRPSYVIAVGTAYSLKTKSHKLGDVLVSAQVRVIDHRRLGPGEVRQRGDNPPASVTLQDRIQAASFSEALSYSVHFGPLLSSNTLLDYAAEHEALAEQHPDAIGGEMEAAGVYSACAKRSVDWIIVKGVSDRGQRKTDRHQAQAVLDAVDLVFRALNQGGLARPPGQGRHR